MSTSISTATVVNLPSNIKALEVIQSADNNKALIAGADIVKVDAILATGNNDKDAEKLLAQARGYWDTCTAKSKDIKDIIEKIRNTVPPPTGHQLVELTHLLEAASAEQALAMQNWSRVIKGLVELQPVSENLSADIASYLLASGNDCLLRWVDSKTAMSEIQKNSSLTWVIEMTAEGGFRAAALQGLASVLRGLLVLQPTVKNASEALTNKNASEALTNLLKRVALVTGLPNEQDAGVNIEEQLKWLFREGMVPDSTLWSAMGAALLDVQENYVDVYKNATSKYLEFQSDFSKEVYSKLSMRTKEPVIKGQVNKDNAAQFIYFNAGPGQDEDGNYGMQYYAKNLYDKYFISDKNDPARHGLAKDQAAVLFPDQADGSSVTGTSGSAAKKWATNMGLSVGHCVRKLADGKYIVQIDPVPLESITNGLSGKGGNIRTQLYDSWSHLFEAESDRVGKGTQALAQQDSHAISVYDNLQKILSTLIEACLEAARNCLRT